MRIGIGVDAHRFVENRPLLLGGVHVEYALGLAGHSDADVLCHAVGDALLGAAGLGDLGHHFPDSDSAWAGISSLFILEKIAESLRERKLKVEYVDSTVICQAPKIARYRQLMEKRIAEALGVDPKRVNVKGTTTEGMGFEGRGEGIAAWAVSLLTES
ncbi:MAG: 2-C-methyl-D-erythritol 2,4-cyclodiphosphate synthase [Candidatus Aminicenantes bacterium]